MSYYQDNYTQLHLGDVRERLRELPANSAQVAITSPPYFQLRDYGVEPILWGGNPDCNHDWKHGEVKDSHYDYGTSTIGGSGKKQQQASSFCVPYDLCEDCGAFRGQLGMEPEPSMFVQDLVQVFREVRRVLRPDGICFIVIGDSYNDGSVKTCKPKDLLGVPWSLTLALREDGWFLRRDVVWCKGLSLSRLRGSVMPESCLDRPTTSHEYIFLLSKSNQYFYNYADGLEQGPYGMGNLRSVWFIPLDGNSTHHTATFPEKLPEVCIRLSTSPVGCCPACGKPWKQATTKVRSFQSGSGRSGRMPEGKYGAGYHGGGETQDVRRGPCVTRIKKEGWNPDCSCDAGDPVPCTVLDPFMGSGTVGVVAKRMGRRFVGIDAVEEFVELSRDRITGLRAIQTELWEG